jgi:hypothetical protein
VYRGAAGRQFVAETTVLAPGVSVAAATSDATLADVDGDGHLDLVLATAKGVQVLYGAGDGTFARTATFSSATQGKGALAVALADLNGDGLLDAAAVSTDASLVSVLLGAPGGTFAPAVGYATGTQAAFDLTIGDVDRDGKLDIVAATGQIPGLAAVGSISILRGAGDGTFRSPLHGAGGRQPSSIVAGDFNRDGILDLALSGVTPGPGPVPGMGPATGTSSIGVLMGIGTGAFRPPVIYPVTGTPHSLRTADIDGNGALDLIAVDSTANDVIVRLNAGDGTFASGVVLPLGPVASPPPGPNPQVVDVADLDGDGLLDLVLANPGSANLLPMFNTTPLRAP